MNLMKELTRLTETAPLKRGWYVVTVAKDTPVAGPFENRAQAEKELESDANYVNKSVYRVKYVDKVHEQVQDTLSEGTRRTGKASAGRQIFGFSIRDGAGEYDIETVELFDSKEKRLAALKRVAIAEMRGNVDDERLDAEAAKVNKLSNEQSVIRVIDRYAPYSGDLELHTLYVK